MQEKRRRKSGKNALPGDPLLRQNLVRSCVALVVIAVAGLTTACQPQLLTPPGEGAVRYRDPVFSAVTKTSDIVYGSAVNQTGTTVTLLMDVYQPTGDTVTKRPLVVWVHGGGFSGGNKTSPEIVDEATVLAKEGYVTASISYRLSANGCSAAVPTGECITAIKDAQHDAQAAVRFLRSMATTYRIDPTRIAIGGTSAGAITALNVAYGADDPGTSGTPGVSSAVSAAVSLSGARLGTAPNAGEPPTLLFHGTADTIVPYLWAQQTVDAATAVGAQADLTSFQGAGHVPYGQNRTTILTQTSNFLYWTMGLLDAPR